MPWKAPITAEGAAFSAPDPDRSWSARRRLLVLGVIVTTLALTVLAFGVWRSNSIPERISWCDRDWVRSRIGPTPTRPPDVSPALPWTTAKKTPAGRFLLPLHTTSPCPANTPTVGYLHHGDRYFSYELSGGP